jgi:serine/threonine protein kinase
MLNSAATLEDNGTQVESEAQPEQTRSPGAGVMRFAYASGSRPLDGFTVKRGIGIGGFGEVYFALSDAGKEVAIKRIQRSMDVEVRGVSQCLNLKHQNLISLFDIKYDDEGQAWVVMEYVAGESLKDVIERNPNGMPEEEVLHWFRGIAHGVGYLHDHGIIHRDLKPGNIFADEGVIKIGDYGLSKYISCSRRSGQTESVGTFHYMAPEIGKGVYGKEIDVYALGVMLCEMLTGAVPFDGESSQEIIMKHLTAEPDLGSANVRYRPILEEALAKDPARRISGVAEMLAKLEGAHNGVKLTPPVRQPAPRQESRQESRQDPYYIADDGESDEGIYFGPVREVVASESGNPRAPESKGPSEPIARAAYTGWHQLKRHWTRSRLGLPAKLALIAGAVFLVIINSSWLVPTGAVLTMVYLPYLAVYHLAASMQKTATASPVSQATSAPIPARARRRNSHQRVNWQVKARASLGERTISERLGELSGSLLTAAIVGSVTSLFMILVGGQPIESIYTWTLYGWLSLTSVVGAWAILTMSKLWEANDGEQFRRRFVMLVVGLGLGFTAFATNEYLQVQPSDQMVVRSLPEVDAWTGMYRSDRSPKLPAFLVYFAGLFVVTRWWLQSDPLRATRLSLWSTATCMLWAWIVHMIWPFPQPWGLMLAATISIAVQLSAPWMSSDARSRIRNQAVEA